MVQHHFRRGMLGLILLFCAMAAPAYAWEPPPTDDLVEFSEGWPEEVGDAVTDSGTDVGLYGPEQVLAKQEWSSVEIRSTRWGSVARIALALLRSAR